MRHKQPSLTAQGAAGYRAAHQTADGGAIFRDPFARRILGAQGCNAADRQAADPDSRPLRLFVAARSRFAEDALTAAVSRGLRQAVVLGAGFDTFALRNPHAGLRVFEMDHPATQDWKRARLAEEGIVLPESLTFVPIDFERQTLDEALAPCGFAMNRPAFYLWLGVVPYLSRDAIDAVLRFVAGRPDSEVVFDYSEPIENYPPERRAHAVALRERVAAIGEPLISTFDPRALATMLHGMSFSDLEDLGGAALAARFFGVQAASEGGGPHLMRARCA